MVVFFDIDGTIVDDRTQIIPSSVESSVKALRAGGHIPVINTGRPYSHIDPRIRAMDFAGFICGCGMEIRLNGETLYENFPDPELCLKVRDAVRKSRMQVLYEARNSTILTDGVLSQNPLLVQETQRFLQKGFPVHDMKDLKAPEFIKLVTFDGEGSCHDLFKEEMEPYFTCIERGHTMLELVKKGCSKAKGMEILLEHLHIPVKDTLAIGDSTNDLPMFRAAAHTVCMGGGMEEVKARAEFITDTVLADGIQKALIHYDLI